MHFTVIRTQAGELDYQHYVQPLLDDPPPDVWDDAEIDLTEDQHPDKIWWLAIADGRVVAFAAIWPDDDGSDLMVCGHNYELGHRDRVERYWPAVFAARQAWIVERGYPCVTWIFDQPVAVHEAAGWRRTGSDGVSEFGHHWQQLDWIPQQ